jgi:RNA polymerase sigma factor (sigma-70 family)
MAHTLIANPLAASQPQASAMADLASDLAARLGSARSRLARLARLRGVPADQAEDVVQETLLTAWRSLDRLRDPERFDAWLDGILRNHCRRFASAQAEEAAPLSALETLDAPAEEADPLDELTQQELATLIDAALGHLREGARQALELRYLAELPSEEVAARLGVTLNALDLRLSRARRQLRETLSGPLRERAVEFGLALAPADEHGWRDTPLWCHRCGHARLDGILEDAPDGGGRMALRCPRCWREAGLIETDIPSMSALSGMKSFRPAYKRLITVASSFLVTALEGEGQCVMCGAPVRAHVAPGDDLERSAEPRMGYPGHYYVVAACARCRDAARSSAASIAALGSPTLRAFLRERKRWIIEPETLTTYDGADAIRFSLYDFATGERLVYFADPQTLNLRGVHSA